mgnify:CR=1 FL=1
MTPNEKKEKKALELALSCRRCNMPTDAHLNEETKMWHTKCECGKSNIHSAKDIFTEVKDLIDTMVVIKKI